MIQTAYILRYRNSEFIQFQNDVINLINRQPSLKAALLTQLTNLQEPVQQMALIFKQQSGTPTTKTLEEADARRDRAIVGIRTLIKSYTYHHQEDKATAANALLRSVDKHGTRISRLNYQSQTAVLDKIVYDWENNPDLQEFVKLLELQEWADELKEANRLFNELYLKRTVEYAKRMMAARMPELREAATLAYRTLLKHIEAHATLTPTEAYTTLLKRLNALIKQYNTLIEDRKQQPKEVVENRDVNEVVETPNEPIKPFKGDDLLILSKTLNSEMATTQLPITDLQSSA